jgi:hypothetical protein
MCVCYALLLWYDCAHIYLYTLYVDFKKEQIADRKFQLLCNRCVHASHFEFMGFTHKKIYIIIASNILLTCLNEKRSKRERRKYSTFYHFERVKAGIFNVCWCWSTACLFFAIISYGTFETDRGNSETENHLIFLSRQFWICKNIMTCKTIFSSQVVDDPLLINIESRLWEKRYKKN